MGKISDRLDDASGIEPEFTEKVRGIVEQTKADAAMGSTHDLRSLLEQRLDEAGLQLAPAEVDALVREAEQTPS